SVPATGGDVVLEAECTAIINALSIAASLAVSRGQNTSVGLSGAGAFSFNSIKVGVDADIVDLAVVHADAGSVELTASDDSEINADAGGVAIAAAQSNSGAAVAASVGLSVAVNTI